MSIAAYRRRQETTETPRELERRAFSTVIGKLVDGQKQGGRLLIEACYLNNQLWGALLRDLAHPDNQLSDDLKARLISIALWVQRYTPEAMRDPAAADALISVNRSILEGLSTDAGETKRPSGPGPAHPGIA